MEQTQTKNQAKKLSTGNIVITNLFRTLSWVALLLGLVGLFVFYYHYDYGFEVVTNALEPVVAQLAEALSFLNNPVLLASLLAGGLLVNIWARHVKVAGKIVATVFLLLLVFGQYLVGLLIGYQLDHIDIPGYAAACLDGFGLGKIGLVLAQDNGIYYVIGIFVVLVIALIVLANAAAKRKPKRPLSGGFLATCLSLIVVVVILVGALQALGYFLPDLVGSWSDVIVYIQYVLNYVLGIGLIFGALGSVFGVIGFWLK